MKELPSLDILLRKKRHIAASAIIFLSPITTSCAYKTQQCVTIDENHLNGASAARATNMNGPFVVEGPDGESGRGIYPSDLENFTNKGDRVCARSLSQ